jgi:hypothetical protein
MLEPEAKARVGIRVAGTGRVGTTILATAVVPVVGPLASRAGPPAAADGRGTTGRAAGLVRVERPAPTGVLAMAMRLMTAGQAARHRGLDLARAVLGSASLAGLPVAPVDTPVAPGVPIALGLPVALAPPAGRAALQDQRAVQTVLAGLALVLAGPTARQVGLAMPPADPVGRPGPAIALADPEGGGTARVRTRIGDRTFEIGRDARRAAAHQPPADRPGRAANAMTRRASHAGTGHGLPAAGAMVGMVPAARAPALKAGVADRTGRRVVVDLVQVALGPEGAMRMGGLTAPTTALAATGKIALAETGKIALAETGKIARQAAAQPAAGLIARPVDPIARAAGQSARLASLAPVRPVASGRGRAGTTSPARRGAGSSGLLGGLAPAAGGTTAARGPAARTGVPRRPVGRTPEDASTGQTVVGASPSAAPTIRPTPIRTSGWTFPTRLPRISLIPKPPPSCGPCQETWPR